MRQTFFPPLSRHGACPSVSFKSYIFFVIRSRNHNCRSAFSKRLRKKLLVPNFLRTPRSEKNAPEHATLSQRDVTIHAKHTGAQRPNDRAALRQETQKRPVLELGNKADDAKSAQKWHNRKAVLPHKRHRNALWHMKKETRPCAHGGPDEPRLQNRQLRHKPENTYFTTNQQSWIFFLRPNWPKSCPQKELRS